VTTPLVFTRKVHFRRCQRGQRQRSPGGPPQPPSLPPGRVPRVARLLALAIKLDGLIRQGAVADYATLARLGHVSPARITQIMNLLQLAPDIQEQILFLPRTQYGRDRVHLRQLQPVCVTLDWPKQRELWCRLMSCGLEKTGA
jgi:hypothetical protein